MAFNFDEGVMRLEFNKFITTISADTPIIGTISHSTATQISGFEFDKIMDKENVFCN